jgi:hypothetical protein
MITLYTTALIIAILFVPGVIFRGLFSIFLPLRKFQRTRTEEFLFAAKVSLAPFTLTVLLALFLLFPVRFPIPLRDGSSVVAAAWETVVHSTVDENFAHAHFDAFLSANRQILIVTANLLLWYYAFLALEAALLGWFSSNYGTFRQNKTLHWLMDKTLLPRISEWHVLLTTFASPKHPGRVAVADVLTTDDHLYHGRVENYYLDKDAKLTGILLADVFRFDRQGYLRAAQQGEIQDRQPFWKRIPGKNVYVFADRITNINLNYEFEVAFRVKNELGIDPTMTLEIESQ